MPGVNTDHISGTPAVKPRRKFDKKWLVVCILVVIVVIAGILVNNNSNDNNATKITGLVDIDNGDLKILLSHPCLEEEI